MSPKSQRTKQRIPKNAALPVMAGVWFALVLARFVFYYELKMKLGDYDAIAGFILVASGLYLVVKAGVSIIDRKNKKKLRSAGIALACAATIGLLWYASLGRDLGIYSWLFRYEGRFKTIVSEVKKEKTKKGRGVSHGIAYEVDAGPPVRVAFPLTANKNIWDAIVYDPKGGIKSRHAEAMEGGGGVAVRKYFHGGRPGPEPVRLWKGWYYCVFWM